MSGIRDVLVIGDINIDVLVRPVRAIRRGTDVDADIRQRPGGAGANVAVGLAGQGVSATLAGCVGTPDFQTVTAQIRTAGVHLAVRPVSDVGTGSVVAIIGPDGERSMASDRGANLALRAADLPDDLVAAHRHVHVSGYTFFDPATRGAAIGVIGRALGLGRTVSVDPASAAPLRGYGVRKFRTDIAGIDLLLPNADEALALSGCSDIDQAARELARDIPVVAVTCGAQGALWADRSGVLRRPATARTRPILDTTGAGDAFTAGLLAAWLDGQSSALCLDSGQRAAADVVTRWGAQ